MVIGTSLLLLAACGGKETDTAENDTASAADSSTEWDGSEFQLDCTALERHFSTDPHPSADDWTGYWECFQEENGCEGEACTWESSDLPAYVTSEICADAVTCTIGSEEVSECAAIENTGSVTVDCSTDGEISITVNGLPDHTFENYAQSGILPPLLGSSETGMEYTLSTRPTYSSDADIFDMGGGTYGVAANGVSIFNQFTGIGTVAVTDETVDDCGGHPANGTYHYHALPSCGTLAESERVGSTGAHSGLMGLSLDGFPILGPHGYADSADPTSEVVRIESCYSLTACTDGTDASCYAFDAEAYENGTCHLDKCNGRVTVVPDALQDALGTDIYAYYLTQDSAGGPAFPYQPYCYRGDAESGEMTGPPEDGQGPPPE
jgi:hypothetical protein